MDGLKACCFGHVTRDPEKRFLPNGTAVVTINLAIEDHKKAEDAPTEWLKVSVWGERGEALIPSDGEPHVHKGDTLYVEGRLKLNTWESNGQRHSGLEMSAWVAQPIGAFRRPGGNHSSK